MNKPYLYPQNLRAEARLWLWSLRDVGILTAALFVSVPALTQLHLYLPLTGTLLFACLTVRPEEQTILDFLLRGFRYFIQAQQTYFWQERSAGTHGSGAER